ncbi:hypothetical protein IW15_06235 [Chryseobacterium soli]|uniref:Alpha glucuronidase N-terminal domain-containing protein n=1 Tax=Chryseobacterium soli TaxID=445961 RepID=A0A086A9M6_9FLAO|nr:DUF4838 domain-containing protein [Chryseobacterium soli]KFF13390.1 hypothetical protein IW15_06235 [Chryseobacterium soli]
MKLITLFLLAISLRLYSQQLVLASGGTSVYHIALAKNADNIEKQSAQEFQRMFKDISGVTLPIETSDFKKEKEIRIGKNSAFGNSFNVAEDGVVIKALNNNLIISGGSRKGVLYAIYTFFENYMGYKVYALDEKTIPVSKNVQIPNNLNFIYSPTFEFRSEYFIESQDKNYADFHKLNYFFENRLYFAHSFGWLLPADKYFKTNPEFFALVNGKRDASQMCFSSEGAIQELIKVLKVEMSLSPNNVVWSVSPLDSPNVCHCNLCEKKYSNGGFTEAMMYFVNKIAIAFPDKTISTLAYNQSLYPSPKTKPQSNVEIMFCYTNVDRSKPISSPENKDAAKFKEAFKEWKKQTNNFFVWDYTVNYFNSLFPFPNIYTLQPNLQYFKASGVKKIFEQGIGPQKGEFSELKSYVIAKLLWNPELDVQTLIDDFLKNYYGPVWTDIKNYINTVNNRFQQSGASLDVYANPVQYKDGYLSDQNIRDYYQILKSALNKVKGNSKFEKRIKKELLSVDYAVLEIGRNDQKRFDQIGGAGIHNKANTFVSEAKSVGITFLRNGELTNEEYQKQIEKKTGK